MTNVVYMKQKHAQSALSFRRRDGALVMELGGTIYERVRLVRTFPHSLPERFLSVRGENGEELALISDLSDLSDECRIIVKEELRRHYLVPVISGIRSIRKQHAMWVWQVETDYGSTSFMTENVHEHVHSVAPERWVISDLDGRRYLISNVAGMDAASRRWWSQVN